MVDINLRFPVTINLQTRYLPAPSFGMLHLTDSDQIPPDIRVRDLTQSGWNDATDGLDIVSTPYAYCAKFFGQEKRKAEKLKIGRLILTATSPFFAMTDYETDPTVWAAGTTGSIGVTDGTNTDQVPVNMTGVTSLTQVAAAFTTGFAAVAVPTVTGLDSAVAGFDNLGRLMFTMPGTGSSEDTISVVAGTTGTDFSDTAYLSATTGTSVAGFDAETLVESYAAVKEYTEDFGFVSVHNEGTDAQQVALAAVIAGESRQLILFEDTSTATNSVSTTDLASLISTANVGNRTSVMYAAVDAYQDAAQVGVTLPADEGSVDFMYEDVNGTYESGSVARDYVLTDPEMTVLDTKGYNWIESLRGRAYAFDGDTVDGTSMRLRLGTDWMAADMQTAMAARRLDLPVLGFDHESAVVYEEVIRGTLEIAKRRKIIESYTLTMPDPDDYTDAQKASGTVPLTAVFDATAVISAKRIQITGTVSL